MKKNVRVFVRNSYFCYFAIWDLHKLFISFIFMSRFRVHELEWRYGIEGVMINLSLFQNPFYFARVGLCLAVVIDAYKKDIASVF